MQAVCVFAGSQSGRRPAYTAAARALGRELAGKGLTLVFGGGHVGLMGVLADAVLEHGGAAIGVIPEDLVRRELAHPGVTELRVVGSMHERKAMMSDRSDAVIALPGGLGTLEELCEILTWAQLGIHAKPCGLLNVAGYYDTLLELLSRAVAEGFMRPAGRRLLLTGEEPGPLLDAMQGHKVLERGRVLRDPAT